LLHLLLFLRWFPLAGAWPVAIIVAVYPKSSVQFSIASPPLLYPARKRIGVVVQTGDLPSSGTGCESPIQPKQRVPFFFLREGVRGIVIIGIFGRRSILRTGGEVEIEIELARGGEGRLAKDRPCMRRRRRRLRRGLGEEKSLRLRLSE